jgi:hypothetical protein
MPSGMSRLGFLASCAAVETASKPYIGEEHDRRGAQHAAPTELAGRLVRRYERALRVGRRHPVLGVEIEDPGDDEDQHDGDLDHHDHIVEAGGFARAENQQSRDGGAGRFRMTPVRDQVPVAAS